MHRANSGVCSGLCCFSACKVKAVTEAAEVVETRFNELKTAVTTVLQSSTSDASATDANGWFKWSKHTRRALHAYICAADDWAVVADTLRKLPKTERVALNISSEPIRHIKSRQEHFDKVCAVWLGGWTTLAHSVCVATGYGYLAPRCCDAQETQGSI